MLKAITNLENHSNIGLLIGHFAMDDPVIYKLGWNYIGTYYFLFIIYFYFFQGNTGADKKSKPKKKWVPKAKYHMQGASQGVTAAASRPRFSSSDGEGSEDDLTSNGEIASSDLGKISGTILGNSI